ncbi:MAG: hypothetical protein GY832_34640 [Chloroflexi bacterium]|nr:hypothetical protein [Chloroflexota bacterium]
MCIRITFPPTDEQIAEAQWALINRLEQTIIGSLRYRDARQSLHQVLRHAREQSDSPQQWVAVFVRMLLDTVSTLPSATRIVSVSAARIERSQSRIVDSLQEQVEKLTQSRDSFLRESVKCGNRATELENLLSLAQDKHCRDIDEHRQQVSDLQTTIADLNRVIAAQQNQLDGHTR